MSPAAARGGRPPGGMNNPTQEVGSAQPPPTFSIVAPLFNEIECLDELYLLPIQKRYFKFEHFRYLGGGVGYLLLTHNDALHSKPVADVIENVERIMAADGELTERDPQSSLFAYWVA